MARQREKIEETRETKRGESPGKEDIREKAGEASSDCRASSAH